MRLIALSIILLSLFSCRKAKETIYETKALDCVEEILKSPAGNRTEAIKILQANSDEFKFARDLEEKISDRQSIENAAKLISSGKLTKAKRVLEDRIVERGYSKELNESVKTVAAAIQLDEFTETSNSLEINEAVREFHKLQILTKNVFGKNQRLTNWLKIQKDSLHKKALDDKKNLLRSLNFTADYASLYKPELFEILLLETAVEQKKQVLPGVSDQLSKNVSRAVNSFGVSKLMENFYNYKRNYEPANLLDKLNITQRAAKEGNTALTLSTLEELQNNAPLAPEVRRKIIKSLFLAKGWNDASLINRDFMDISFILETVYKANQE